MSEASTLLVFVVFGAFPAGRDVFSQVHLVDSGVEAAFVVDEVGGLLRGVAVTHWNSQIKQRDTCGDN